MIVLPPTFQVIARADGLVDLVCDGILVPRRGNCYRGWTLAEAEHVADRLDYYAKQSEAPRGGPCCEHNPHAALSVISAKSGRNSRRKQTE